MKYVYLALNWIFGVLLLLTGLVFLIELPLAGLSLVAISLLLLPPVRSFAHSKTNKEISVKARAISILVLFVTFGVFVGQSQEKEKAEQAAQLRQQNIDYFNANRDQIISSVKASLSAKEYQSVISQSAKYLVSGDKELSQMNALAKARLAEIQKAEKTEQLLAELKTVPTEEYKKNKNLYQQLVSLHPDNETYKNKVRFYSGKIEGAKQKRLAAEARKKQIERQFSDRDGSHGNLERVIKQSMNDPDSYDHVETVYWDRGDHLVVRTTFRGKNAFGGIVKNSVKAKVSLDGQVLQILE